MALGVADVNLSESTRRSNCTFDVASLLGTCSDNPKLMTLTEKVLRRVLLTPMLNDRDICLMKDRTFLALASSWTEPSNTIATLTEFLHVPALATKRRRKF